MPIRRAGRAQESGVKIKEKVSLLLVTKHLDTILLQDLNLVMSESLGCASMKISCVLVPFDSGPILATLFPMTDFFFNHPAEEKDNNLPEQKLLMERTLCSSIESNRSIISLQLASL